MNRSRLLKIATLVFVLILLGLIFFGLSNKKPKTGINLLVVPSDAIGLVNGTVIVRGGLSSLPPGQHSITVTRRGFADKNQSFVVKNNSITKVIFILEPNSQEGYDWLNSHPEEVLRAEGLSGEIFDQESRDSREKNPLIEYLPFVDLEFRIDYGASIKNPDDPSATAIYIKYSSENGKAEALEWISFKGFDPEKLEIIYGQIDGFN